MTLCRIVESFPMEAALRLLVALSGGHDAHTFHLEDPTRVSHEVRSYTRLPPCVPLLVVQICSYIATRLTLTLWTTVVQHQTAASATVPRIARERMGERIHMKNVRLVLDSHAMFDAESIPLREQTYVSVPLAIASGS